MYVFKGSNDLQQYLRRLRSKDASIGFVPTMGALHEGHLSLIRQSQADNQFTICSIFVNPTQFNETSDLEKYPRTPGNDIAMLCGARCDVLFLPTVAEVYPAGLDTEVDVDLGQLDRVLEGKFRPGHFAGVVQVVRRLLNLVQPDRLYMGQKDYQQFTIIREMIRQLKLPVEIIMAPIVREPDGLAMSSRNTRLSPADRLAAPIIYKTLREARQLSKTKTPAAVRSWALEQLQTAGLRPEYFELVDGETLQPISALGDSDSAVACTAVWAGNVRLIDNVVF